MRALVFHGSKDIRVEQRHDPRTGSGEVSLRLRAVGICGSDIHGYSGETGRRAAGMVMGHEASGVVEAVGAGVSGISEGDAVTFNPILFCGECPLCAAGHESLCPNKRVIGVTPDISGAFAERMVVSARNVVALPAQLSLEHGALVEPMAVGLHAVALTGVGPGDT